MTKDYGDKLWSLSTKKMAFITDDIEPENQNYQIRKIKMAKICVQSPEVVMTGE